MASEKGNYRTRTWLRATLPYFLSDRIPKGPRDCGDHEWYRRDEHAWECYHCVVGVWEREEIREAPEDAPAPARDPDLVGRREPQRDRLVV